MDYINVMSLPDPDFTLPSEVSDSVLNNMKNTA